MQTDGKRLRVRVFLSHDGHVDSSSRDACNGHDLARSSLLDGDLVESDSPKDLSDLALSDLRSIRTDRNHL